MVGRFVVTLFVVNSVGSGTFSPPFASYVKYPVKIEYYKTITGKENVENKYGIEIVKTEYKEENINIEKEEIYELTNNSNEADKILTLLRDNEVTPIAIKDVLYELR